MRRQGRSGRIQRAGFNVVIEPLWPHDGLGGALVQLGNVLAVPLDALLPAIQQRGENVFNPLGVRSLSSIWLTTMRSSLSMGSRGPCSRFRSAVPGSNRHR